MQPHHCQTSHDSYVYIIRKHELYSWNIWETIAISEDIIFTAYFGYYCLIRKIYLINWYQFCTCLWFCTVSCLSPASLSKSSFHSLNLCNKYSSWWMHDNQIISFNFNHNLFHREQLVPIGSRWSHRQCCYGNFISGAFWSIKPLASLSYGPKFYSSRSLTAIKNCRYGKPTLP